jgi:hypothetical protein
LHFKILFFSISAGGGCCDAALTNIFNTYTCENSIHLYEKLAHPAKGLDVLTFIHFRSENNSISLFLKSVHQPRVPPPSQWPPGAAAPPRTPLPSPLLLPFPSTSLSLGVWGHSPQLPEVRGYHPREKFANFICDFVHFR